MWKKLGIGIAGLLAIIVAAVLFVLGNLDYYILSAIEKNGSAATGTQVSAGHFGLSLTTGHVKLSGLIVGNPPGYSTPNAVALGTVTIQAETGSLLGNGPIMIDRITIDQPHIYYEIRGGDKGLSLSSLNIDSTSNLAQLQKNIEAYAKANPSGGPKRKEIIKELTVTNGKVSVSSSLLKGQHLTEKLPVIHLAGIGETTGGVTSSQAAEQVLTAITTQAELSGAASLVKAIGKAAVGPIGSSLASKIKSLF